MKSQSSHNIRRIFLLVSASILLVSVGSRVGIGDGQKSVIQIAITGFRNNKGTARIALFKKEDGFPSEVDKAYWKGQALITKQTCDISIVGIPYGAYAVSVYHDENGNDVLDKKWGIIPEEGFGASKNKRELKRAPKFSEAAFIVNTDTTFVQVKIEYLFDKE